MKYQNQNMAGLFGFPTSKVTREAGGGMPATVGISVKMTDDVYDSYKKAILENDFAPYLWTDSSGTVHHEVKYFVMQDTGLDEFEVTSILKAIHDLAKSGQIENQYWNIEKQLDKPAIPGLSTVTNMFDKYSSMMKWSGVIALVAVGLYLSWPVLMKMRKKFK